MNDQIILIFSSITEGCFSIQNSKSVKKHINRIKGKRTNSLSTENPLNNSTSIYDKKSRGNVIHLQKQMDLCEFQARQGYTMRLSFFKCNIVQGSPLLHLLWNVGSTCWKRTASCRAHTCTHAISLPLLLPVNNVKITKKGFWKAWLRRTRVNFTFLPHEILTAGSNNESCINEQTITAHENPQDLLWKCKLEWEC